MNRRCGSAATRRIDEMAIKRVIFAGLAACAVLSPRPVAAQEDRCHPAALIIAEAPAEQPRACAPASLRMAAPRGCSLPRQKSDSRAI